MLSFLNLESLLCCSNEFYLLNELINEEESVKLKELLTTLLYPRPIELRAFPILS